MYLNRLFPRSLKPLTHLTQLRTVLLWFSVFRKAHPFHLPIQKVHFLCPPSAPISHLDHISLLTSLLGCSAHRICRTSLLLLPCIGVAEGCWSEPLPWSVLCWCTPQDIRTTFLMPLFSTTPPHLARWQSMSFNDPHPRTFCTTLPINWEWQAKWQNLQFLCQPRWEHLDSRLVV